MKVCLNIRFEIIPRTGESARLYTETTSPFVDRCLPSKSASFMWSSPSRRFPGWRLQRSTCREWKWATASVVSPQQDKHAAHSVIKPGEHWNGIRFHQWRTRRITYALIHPSFSQLFVIWAHRPQTTFPPAVTKPSSLTFTSIIVPLVNTPGYCQKKTFVSICRSVCLPSCVYIGFCGFFFTLIIGSWTVTPSSGC